METKFTKGKWKTDNASDTVLVCTEKETLICLCNTPNSFDEDVYNALLISKAPEMFEMLEKWSILNPEHYKDLAGFINETKQLLKEATEL